MTGGFNNLKMSSDVHCWYKIFHWTAISGDIILILSLSAGNQTTLKPATYTLTLASYSSTDLAVQTYKKLAAVTLSFVGF